MSNANEGEERWLEGTTGLFQERRKRREEDAARRTAGRRLIKGADVQLEYEEKNGIWQTGLVSRDKGFDNRIIEVDTHIYPPGSQSATHRHNEAVIFVLRGAGRSFLDGEPVEWEAGDTLYIPAGVWHSHEVTSTSPAFVIAAKPLPLQEYLGELHIEYVGDTPTKKQYTPGTFKDELAQINDD